MIQVGAAEGAGFAPIESAFGRPLDRKRTYTTIGIGPLSTWAADAAKYDLDISIAYSDAQRRPYKATDITGHVYDDQLRAIMTAIANLPHGQHRVTGRHEEDAKTAALSGNYAALNDAELAVAELAYRTAGFPANCRFGVSWTGFDLKQREPQLRPSLAPAEFVAIDPYLFSGQPWITFDALVGPELDYLSATDPDLEQCIWEFGCDARAGRPAWFAGIPTAIKANPQRYRNLTTLDYWNAGDSTLDAAGLAALGAAFRQLAP